MPNQLPRACKYLNCGGTTTRKNKLCDKHNETKDEDLLLNNPQEYEAQKFYHTTAWRKLRKWFIANNPLCIVCGDIGHVVDHKIPIKRGGERYDINNLQTMCNFHHNQKRASERG